MGREFSVGRSGFCCCCLGSEELTAPGIFKNGILWGLPRDTEVVSPYRAKGRFVNLEYTNAILQGNGEAVTAHYHKGYGLRLLRMVCLILNSHLKNQS